MSLEEISLVGLSGLSAFGVTFFNRFRNRMSRDKEPSKHSRNRILKFIAFNLILNAVAYIGFILTFLNVFTKPGIVITTPIILVSALFLISSAITFYGCGIYITAVILETLTPPGFRKLPYLSRQFKVTNMFHGPISHTIMFSGYIIAFSLLCVLDLMTGPSISSIPRLFLISGALLGLSAGYAQISSGNAPFQTITGVLSVIALVILDQVEGWKFTQSPIGIYMIGFFITFLFLNVYTIVFRWKGKNIWSRSGYREYN